MNPPSSPALPHYTAGADAFTAGKFEESLTLFRAAAEADPAFFRAHAYLGLALTRLGRTEEAIEAYRKCIEIAPDYHKAYNNVGELYRQKGQLDYAAMVFQMATEIDTTNAPYFYNLGLTYNDMGMRPQAEAALARAWELDPTDWDTMSELSQARFYRKDFTGALAPLESFLARHPDHDRIPELRARMQMLKRKQEEP